MTNSMLQQVLHQQGAPLITDNKARRETDDPSMKLKEMMLRAEDPESRALIQVLETMSQSLRVNSEAVQLGNAMTSNVAVALEAHISHFRTYEAQAAEKSNQQDGAMKVLNRIIPWILGVCQVLVFSAMAGVGAEVLRTRSAISSVKDAVELHIVNSAAINAEHKIEINEVRRTIQNHLSQK